jgi:hypothetical protein
MLFQTRPRFPLALSRVFLLLAEPLVDDQAQPHFQVYQQWVVLH